MRLKRLKIFGFKSFAEEVVLNFDYPLVALVGPNGCGKSNIVDAIRWVIGEQSAKSMRADKMQDILFAGSEKKKPLNLAEVSIEIELQEQDFTITRRLHANNESVYLINKEQVRLKDIQNLLLDSGIGKSAFSIFEQGKLDEIIYLNPIERRAIFDEASEISKYLLRKKDAKKRLEEVTTNFERIKDIHLEVDKRRKALKKQAEEAKNFQEKKTRVKELERGVLEKRLSHLQEALSKQIHENETLSKEGERLENALKIKEKARATKESQVLEKERDVKNLEKVLMQLRIDFNSLCLQQKNETERLTELKEREKKCDADQEALSKTGNNFSLQIENEKERSGQR